MYRFYVFDVSSPHMLQTILVKIAEALEVTTKTAKEGQKSVQYLVLEMKDCLIWLRPSHC